MSHCPSVSPNSSNRFEYNAKSAPSRATAWNPGTTVPVNPAVMFTGSTRTIGALSKSVPAVAEDVLSQAASPLTNSVSVELLATRRCCTGLKPDCAHGSVIERTAHVFCVSVPSVHPVLNTIVHPPPSVVISQYTSNGSSPPPPCESRSMV